MKNGHNTQANPNRLNRKAIGTLMALSALAACGNNQAPNAVPEKAPQSAASISTPGTELAVSAPTNTILTQNSIAVAPVETVNVMDIYLRTARDTHTLAVSMNQLYQTNDPEHQQVASSETVDGSIGNSVTKYTQNPDNSGYNGYDVYYTFKQEGSQGNYDPDQSAVITSVNVSVTQLERLDGELHMGGESLTIELDQNGKDYNVIVQELNQPALKYTTDPLKNGSEYMPLTEDGEQKVFGRMQYLIEEMNSLPGVMPSPTANA